MPIGFVLLSLIAVGIILGLVGIALLITRKWIAGGVLVGLGALLSLGSIGVTALLFATQ